MEKGLLKELKKATNYTHTENGAITHKSTLNKCYDLFAFGGALRNRSEQEILDLFYFALKEDKLLAMKLLFYIRDARGGLGERRTFRVILKSLANSHPQLVEKNMELIPYYGRYDDLLVLFDTKCESKMIEFIARVLIDDCGASQPSLLAKWLPSECASSSDSKRMARRLAKGMSLSRPQYRKMLSKLRARINIIETLLTEKRYDEIKFDKIPSCAGLKYRNTFLRYDELTDRYLEFLNNKETKVNANVLYPYDIVRKAWSSNEEEALSLDKYWECLPDYFEGKSCSMLPVIDNSGSMRIVSCRENVRPLDVAISLGIYCAERNHGEFHNHYISFSSKAKLVEINGINIAEKVKSCLEDIYVDTTNIESVFDLVLNTLKEGNLSEEYLPKCIVIISDMEFDEGTSYYGDRVTLMESIRKKWAEEGYTMPSLVYWNVDSRQNNISDLGADNITYVSGCTPMIFECIMRGKSGIEFMLEILNNNRYSSVMV